MSTRRPRAGSSARSSHAPLIIVTPGDPAGIGPEVTWKALQSRPFKSARILCLGARAGFERLGAPIELAEFDESGALLSPQASQKNPRVWLLESPRRAPKGRLLAGFQAGWSIERAVALIQAGVASALVTGPIHKQRLQAGGYLYDGHTDFLASLCGVPSVTMMLANRSLRSSLVTVHTSLASVPEKLTPAALERAIRQTVEGLRTLWGISKPRVAVAGLNPHAGEGGLFGSEEKRVIEPTLKRLKKDRSLHATLEGPLPADTLFAKHVARLKRPSPEAPPYDAVVSMYHDQGLIPVKLLDFGGTVNLTLGLPLIRTSVDHGTAFDIAGKNVADPSSMMAAIDLATAFLKKRV